MDFQVSVRKLARNEPSVLRIAFGIELDETERRELCDPNRVFVDDDVERNPGAAPRLDELELPRVGRRLEHVDARARSIKCVNAPFGPNCNGVHAIELTGTGSHAPEFTD